MRRSVVTRDDLILAAVALSKKPLREMRDLPENIEKQIESGKWYRADGNCKCKVCGLPYRKHRYIENAAANRICNGDLVHL